MQSPDALLDRNLALELVRVTEAAAMGAAGNLGRGDKTAIDGAAVRGMRSMIGTVSTRGVVVIGEGEKELVAQIRRVGARVKLIQDGDEAAAILTATPGAGVDMSLGIGGTPEGIRCYRGDRWRSLASSRLTGAS